RSAQPQAFPRELSLTVAAVIFAYRSEFGAGKRRSFLQSEETCRWFVSCESGVYSTINLSPSHFSGSKVTKCAGETVQITKDRRAVLVTWQIILGFPQTAGFFLTQNRRYFFGPRQGRELRSRRLAECCQNKKLNF